MQVLNLVMTPQLTYLHRWHGSCNACGVPWYSPLQWSDPALTTLACPSQTWSEQKSIHSLQLIPWVPPYPLIPLLSVLVAWVLPYPFPFSLGVAGLFFFGAGGGSSHATASFFTYSGSGVGVRGRFWAPLFDDRPMGGMRIPLFFHWIRMVWASPKVKMSASGSGMGKATSLLFSWTKSILTMTYPSCTGTVYHSLSLGCTIPCASSINKVE